jgi:hypothetical protein
MGISEARDGSDRILGELAEARRELRDRLAAASAFKAALAGKAASLGPRSIELDAEAGVLRARRHELETSLECLESLEASVEETRERVGRAERAWLAARQARLRGIPEGPRD